MKLNKIIFSILFLVIILLVSTEIYAACSGSGNACSTMTISSWCSQYSMYGCTWDGVSCIGSNVNCNGVPSLPESLCTGAGCTWDGPSTCTSGICCVGGVVASSSVVCSATSPTWSCSSNIVYGNTLETHCNGVSATLCNGAVTSASFIRNNCNNYEAFYCTDGVRTGPSADVCDTSYSRCSDGLDNDADGLRDCSDTDCATAMFTWYKNADGDSYYTNLYQCANPGAGWSQTPSGSPGDCDDTRANVYPGYAEVCDGLDNNCAGGVDDGLALATCGVGACARTGSSCFASSCTAGTAGTETCNGVDDDCNGVVDNGVTPTSQTCFSANAFGNCSGSQTRTCGGVSGWGSWGACSAATPAAEICDGLDNNCAGGIDNGLTAPSQVCGVGTGACYAVGTQVRTCNGVSGWSAFGSCSATPGTPGTETCNNIDDNCNGNTDEGCDDDGDDYCDSSMTYVGSTTCPNGGGDTDDTSPGVNPGTNWYLDSDGDKYVTGSATTQSTSPGALYIYTGILGYSDCASSDNTKWQNLLSFRDADLDTYTDGTAATNVCSGATRPAGYLALASSITDCNDADPTLNTPDSCICATYIPYYQRIGFSNLESPMFRVPDKPTTITRVCDLYSGTYRSSTPTVVLNGASVIPVAFTNPRVVVSSVNLPVCNDFGSLTQYCNELGYDSYDNTLVVSGTSGSCARGPSWTSSTGTTTNSVSCRFDSMGSTFNVAFNLNIQGTGMQSYKYGCSGNDIQGQIGADGVCVDNFVVTPLCGFNATGFPVDPDCGNHINMTQGVVRKADSTVVSIIPAVPTPKPHKACAVSTDCVTNVGGQLNCVSLGTQLTTGSSDTFTQAINITCTTSNTWCFKGYNYDSLTGRCTFISGESCYTSTCPALNNFAILPDGTTSYNGDIYKLSNTGDSCYVYNIATQQIKSCTQLAQTLTESRLEISDGLNTLIRNDNCIIKTGTRVRGVCVATQTYPELKYNIQNVIIK